MPASTGGSVYCFFIVDCYSNLGWPIFLKNKSADTVTHAFRAFLAAIKPLREKHGEPGTLRTDNGTQFVNEPFSNLLVQYGIRREFTSVDGPKRNGRVERRIALVKEGARAAWLGFPRLFPDVWFPSRTMHYSAVWPEAWSWMSENINITSRVDSPDKRCPEEKLYGKRLRKQLLPFLMPGHRTRGSGLKWAGKADPCFYLNGENDHASDCDKVMLESGIVSFTTNATYAYRRVPFVGQRVTFGNGIIRAPSPPPAATSMGGSGTGGLAGQPGESDAATALSPPPAASSAGRGDVGVLRDHPGRKEGIGGGTTLPSLSPVAPLTEGDTSGLQSQSEEWRKSDRLDIPAQQDNPRSQSRRHTVTPAVTRSAARAQLGVGDQPGAFTVLSAKESIHAAISTSAAPHSGSPELPTCPTCDLETPATHAQAHAGPHSNIWRAAEDKEFGGLRAVGIFEELGGTKQRGINIISAKWLYSWKSDEFGNVVRAKARLVARGFGQREGIDFFDTFSPCPSVMSIRLLAALGCELDLDLCHFDAEQAFVQSYLDEVVYIRLPPRRGSMIGEGGDTTISSPGKSPKHPLPGIGLHDPLHGRQACPEFIAFDQGVGQICPR